MTPPLPRWPDLHLHWRQALEAARTLNAAGVSALPLRALPALSVSTLPEYRGNRAIAGPRRRALIQTALGDVGYACAAGGTLRADGWPAVLVYPGTPESLRDDPAAILAEVTALPDRIALLTPTQSVLLLVRTNGGRVEPALQHELLHLAWEQEIDLGFVAQWAGETNHGRLFALLPTLRHWQARGREQRRRGAFASFLPHP